MQFLFSLLLMGTFFFHAVDSSWWYLSQIDQASPNDRRAICEIAPNLNRKQRQICNRNPELIKVIGSGVSKGISECQYQFRYHKWNCSTFLNDSTLFGKSLVKGGTREIAFVQAMHSASAIYKLARSCSKGHSKCGCSSEIPNGQRTNETKYGGTFHWDGCEQVVKFSTNFVRRFVDAPDFRHTDGKAKLTLHNNRVGRIVVRKKMKRICKCHGLSGSCSVQTCWSTLPSFRVIGNALREKYDSAIEVTFKPSGHITPADKRQKKPSKFDFIYYDPSPDYCRINYTQGSLGTYNRICQKSEKNAEGEESCDILCCRQKYEFTRVRYSHFCNCTFSWCCQVNCNSCNATRIEYRCK